MTIFSSVELLLQAKNYSGSGDWIDESGNSHDAQIGDGTTASTFPLFLAYTGTQYLYVPGISGNYASAPDSAALSITGDIDIQYKVALDDWTPAPETVIVSKYTTIDDQRSYIFTVRSGSTGLLRFYWSEDGVALLEGTSSVAPTVSDGDWLWIRATLDVDGGAGGEGRVTFYTGGSGTSPIWVQLGDTADAGSAPTSIFDGSAPVEVGSHTGGSTSMLPGKVANVRIYSDLTETTLVFDADFTDRSALTEPFSTFTEKSPNAATVTISRSASGRVSTVVDRPMFLLGTDDYLAIPDHADLDFANGEDLTLMVAGRLNVASASSVLAGKKTISTANAGYALAVFSGDIWANVGDGAVGSSDTIAEPPVQTAMIAALVRNTTNDDVEAFKNGIGSGSHTTDATTVTLANGSWLMVGVSPALIQYFDGEIHTVALWREALTNTQIVEAGYYLVNGTPPDTSDLLLVLGIL